jgi:nitrous oxidase accessory protein NosD
VAPGVTLRNARTLGVLLVALALAVSGTVSAGSGLGSSALDGADPSDPVASTGAEKPNDAAQTEIDSCTTIDEPGNYVLTTEIENGGKTPISKACIEITADDVTLDGGGHLIDGRGESHTKGIAVIDAEGVAIENVEVDDWHSGILVSESSVTVRDVRTFSNAYGLRLENATDVSVENSTVEENLVGIYTNTESLSINGTDFSGNEVTLEEDY